MNINYQIIADAIKYYEELGFLYVSNAPWVVSREIIEITLPKNIDKDKMFAANPNCFVASGEQSFLEMILLGQLNIGKYCCATPCFRPFDNLNDGIHFQTFMKVELINYLGSNLSSEWETFAETNFIATVAKSFMSQYSKYNISKTDIINDDERYGCETLYCFDLERQNDDGSVIELGSYGLRKLINKDLYWVYGTGVAVPRLTYSGV